MFNNNTRIISILSALLDQIISYLLPFFFVGRSASASTKTNFEVK